MAKKDEKVELLNKWLSHISKYPFLIDFTRKGGLNIYIRNEIMAYSDSEKKEYDDLVNEYFAIASKIVETFETVEKNVMKTEEKLKYQVPIFNYNADMVIAHSRKISDYNHRLIYLKMVLSYWQNHLPRRYQELNIQFGLLEEDFFAGMMTNYGNIFSYMIENIRACEYNFPEIIIGFDERLILEIKTIEQLRATEGDAVLEAINNPKGTKKRQWQDSADDEVNEAMEDKKQSEWMTSEEVMSFLNVKRTTIHNYKTSKKLLPTKLAGKQNRYKREDVLKLLQKR